MIWHTKRWATHVQWTRSNVPHLLLSVGAKGKKLRELLVGKAGARRVVPQQAELGVGPTQTQLESAQK